MFDSRPPGGRFLLFGYQELSISNQLARVGRCIFGFTASVALSVGFQSAVAIKSADRTAESVTLPIRWRSSVVSLASLDSLAWKATLSKQRPQEIDEHLPTNS
jgi:hypothetical protein